MEKEKVFLKSKYKTSDYSIRDDYGETNLALFNKRSGKYDIEIDFKRKEIRIVMYGTFDPSNTYPEKGWKIINGTKLKVVNKQCTKKYI